MIGIVSRTCTEIPPGSRDWNLEKKSRPLRDFRSRSAYVLLGDPGAGKTTAFDSERRALGDNACLVDARDFVSLDLNSRPEWRGKTLFIDGLDEIRAGSSDVRTPFDEIRRRLDGLGRPRFRLSCRTVDWLGENDRRRLKSVAPEAAVTVLQLDPLTESKIVEILTARQDIADPSECIQTARDQRLYGLLANPLTLKMLADVVGSGRRWPESRKQTFEMACSRIVQEHNDEHQAAAEPEGPPAPDRLLDAAGCLCAVQLLSGIAGYSIQSNEALADYPSLDRCDHASPELLRGALRTKLFKGDSVDRFVPIHRHISEFLGGRYLARVIEDRLPARRVLALITGEDGIVVTELRGFSAWLAVHCKEARADLIVRDPVGVVLYGDIGEFSIDEKRALLRALEREVSRLSHVWRLASACGALATADMEPAFRKILGSDDRTDEQQTFTYFLLCVLIHGIPIPNLSGILLEIIRDDTHWSRINALALDAFIFCNPGEDLSGELRPLLSDIRSGHVFDPDNEILGRLLAYLYPHEVGPFEVWNYFPTNWNEKLIGRDYLFWNRDLVTKSSEADVSQLLDSFQEQSAELWPALERRDWGYLPIKLLARGLKTHGEQLGTETLYDWLRIGLSWKGRKDESIQEIRSWLNRHMEVQKDILVEGLERWEPEFGDFRNHAFEVEKCLFGASRPPDLGRWCLDQAVARADTSWQVSKYFLEQAFWANRNQSLNEGLSLELLRERTQGNDRLSTTLTRLLAPPATPEWRLKLKREHKEFVEQRKRQESEWLDYVRSQEAALRENRAHVSLLYRMADKYLEQHSRGGHGPEAIEKLVHGDSNLTEATLMGLRGTVTREDVPDLTEIFQLNQKGQFYNVGLPFMAGLEELDRTASEDPFQWDARRIRKALAFYFCTPHDGDPPNWYLSLVRNRPETVAEVLVQFAVSGFRSDRNHINRLYELAHDPEHAGVARHSSLALLRAVPIRCRVKHLPFVEYLLWAALQRSERPKLGRLIERKLSCSSMNVAQRVYWLAAGVIVSPMAHKDRLKNFVKGSEGRIRRLVDFFSFDHRVQFSFDQLMIPVLELLIRLVGNTVGPYEWADTDGAVTNAQRSSDLVDKLIRTLAASLDPGVARTLDQLCSSPELSRWRNVVSRARDAQRVTRRDARYRHPDIEQVCKTLDGATPANAGDLAALLMDRLGSLGEGIRTGNTDDWRQYWNEDHHGRPRTPKHEDSCRDAILSDLRRSLPRGVDAQPEGQYARDKRADIRISCRDFQVPVEIKKNSHADLWRACRTQLIEQYTRDPATGGYGIYLVFWFGPNLTQRSPSGHRPANPQELRKRLRETLSEDEARKISIKVIDVSGDL